MIDFELLQPPITTSYPSHPSQEDRRIVASEVDFTWNSTNFSFLDPQFLSPDMQSLQLDILLATPGL